MAEKLRYTVLPNPQVMVMNRTVLGAGAENVRAPGECTNASSVPLELSYHLLGLEIPDLDDTTVGAYTQMGAPACPIDRCYLICAAQVVKLGDLRACRRPDVDTARQTNY